MSVVNVEANRAARKWSRRQQVGRVLWALVWPFFRLSPRPLWGWRRFLLRAFGANIDKGVHVYPSVRIAIPWNLEIREFAAVGEGAILYSLGPIVIGPRSTVSQYAHLCAGSHDLSSAARTLTKPPVVLESDVWVAADAFIGPGVTIGSGSVVGARAVVVRDVEPNEVVAGNPARSIKRVSE